MNKAGLILALLSPEAEHPNLRGVRTEWLVSEWAHWIYPECPVGKVRVLRSYPAPLAGEMQSRASSTLHGCPGVQRTSNSPTSTVSARSFSRIVTIWSFCLAVPQWVVRRSIRVVAPVTSCWRLPK
ncbi:hypothetical protein G4Q77_12205 [Stenotrophomonas maltophilia]|nr:hypothetical protein [Stenotrophomonas maltophilia]